MRVAVLFFAGACEVVGSAQAHRDLSEGAPLQDLVEALFAAHPALAEMRLRFAVNSSYADPDTVLREGDEVACIPPVGGG